MADVGARAGHPIRRPVRAEGPLVPCSGWKGAEPARWCPCFGGRAPTTPSTRSVPSLRRARGRRKFWILLTFVMVLHAINTYRDSQKLIEPDLPPGAIRRLPGGKLLMADGSTQKEEESTEHTHRLHKYKDVGEDELALDRLWRYLKDALS